MSENSIKAHAEEAAKRGEISEPAEVTDAMLRKGAYGYQAMRALSRHAGRFTR